VTDSPSDDRGHRRLRVGFGVTPTDVMAYALVTAVTIAAALLACLIPAYRAPLVDPATLLRSEES
jgi:putative ABC transport system permease protein